MPNTPASTASYGAEVRFAVVMYGGVSLAIYINGVANEMYEMAHATPRGDVPPPPATGEVANTREVYRRLSWLSNDPALVARYAAWLQAPELGPDPLLAVQPGDIATRFVVDVIAGTSAGGINGLFLGKALANNEPFSPLRQMWIDEGDIGGLLNDARSYDDPDMRGYADRSADPASLLNSDRMYRKLRIAMDRMSAQAVKPAVPSVAVDELDLFVTTTDIRGSLVKLRLFDKVVYEKRHRQVFRLRYAQNGVQAVENDLQAANNAFLSFVARCTSSFPFAFEPMTLQALERLEPGMGSTALRQWDRHFTGIPPDEVARGEHMTRAFGDGGYLDNKPFTHAVTTLSARSATVPVERKLVYVEPAPAHPESDRPDGEEPPDALTNALAALTSIPSYETIREDLEAVLRRNRRIERIDRIVRMGELELDTALREGGTDPLAGLLRELRRENPEGRLDWRALTMRQMRNHYGDAYLPYARLRHYTVTDDLADRLAATWQLPADSDHVYALRSLVRAWREEHYGDRPPAGVQQADGRWRGTLNAFLDDHDIAYRVRRTAFLLRRVDQLSKLVNKRLLDRLEKTANEADEALLRRLRTQAALDLHDPALDATQLQAALDALLELKRRMASAHAMLRHGLVVPPDDARRAALRAQLRPGLLQVLDLLLLSGSTKTDSDAVPVLQTTDGKSTRVVFPAEMLKLPSSSRTLQEGVFMRAKKLMQLARETAQTSLQELLEHDLQAIGGAIRLLTKGADDRPPVGGALLWASLGGPRLDLAPTGTGEDQVYVLVGATGEPVLDTGIALQLRRFLGDYYLRFDTYDQMSFPLYYDTESGEPATVEVVRISPEDAKGLIDEEKVRAERRKLAGTALANFGAFLQRHWRTNDIMWGRLDGAERLVTALLPALDADSTAVRRHLVEQAHRCILREALRPDTYAQITGLLCDALAEVDKTLPPPPPGQPRDKTALHAALLKDLMARLAPEAPASQRRLEQVVGALLDDEALLRWVREARSVDRRPDPEPLLDNAARAVTITGRLLEGVAARRDLDLPVVRWLARFGLVAQGLLAVSVPGSLRGMLWAHWLKVLYAFELTMLALGLLFASEPVRTTAVTALGITALVHGTTLLLGDVMRSRKTWKAKGAWALAVPVVLLALTGVLALTRVGWKALLGID
ncbi:patatin-like protein [Rubrivivax sp. RP6-9]|uniref:patatin-like protein n=1 Tax=Rubrivivax sp. RP6-9 TaxID=3415750 RepID=UPI003CC54564